MGNTTSCLPDEFKDENPCSTDPSEQFTIPDFCGNSSSCNDLGAFGEWRFLRETSSNECCIGNKLITCQRTRFRGNLEKCCSQNHDLTQNRSDCFSDINNLKTCSPAYRGSGGSGCRDRFNTVCVNSSTSLEEMNKIWTRSSFCPDMITSNTEDPSGLINQNNLSWAQNAMANTFSKFLFFTDGEIKQPGLESDFQRYLYNFCLENPAACQVGLNASCNGYTNLQTSTNSNIANMCGCHLNNVNYQVYENLYGVPRQCTPVCARAFTVPSVDTLGSVQSCEGTICIIDNVTFQLSNSNVGDINFFQSCGSCSASGSANCFCSISGVNLQTAESRLGGVDLIQRCQGSLRCYRDNPNDPNLPAVEVSCDAPNDHVPTQQEINQSLENASDFSQSQGISRGVGLSILLLFIISFVVILLIFVQQNEQPVNRETYQTEKQFSVSEEPSFLRESRI